MYIVGLLWLVLACDLFVCFFCKVTYDAVSAFFFVLVWGFGGLGPAWQRTVGGVTVKGRDILSGGIGGGRTVESTISSFGITLGRGVGGGLQLKKYKGLCITGVTQWNPPAGLPNSDLERNEQPLRGFSSRRQNGIHFVEAALRGRKD